jgi:hypothetical protein
MRIPHKSPFFPIQKVERLPFTHHCKCRECRGEGSGSREGEGTSGARDAEEGEEGQDDAAEEEMPA